MELGGRKAATVEHNQERVLGRSPPGAVLQMPATGGTDWWIEHRHRPGPAQSSGKLKVLHQGERAEAAEGAKDFSPNEYRLVAKKASTVTSEEARQALEREEIGMALVEFAIKRTARNGWVLECRANGAEMQVGQLRIGVMKNEDVAVSACRPEVHLCTAIRRFRWEIDGAGAVDDLRGRQARRSVDDDDLIQLLQSNEFGKASGQFGGIIPGGNNNRESQAGLRWWVHLDFFKRLLRARSNARRSLAVRLPIPEREIFSSTGSIAS